MLIPCSEFWRQISPAMTDTPQSCYEIALKARVSRSAVSLGLVYARSRGLVCESFVKGKPRYKKLDYLDKTSKL